MRAEPLRYRAAWDLTTRNAFGDVRPEDVAALTEGDEDIEGLTGSTMNSVLVDDELTVPVMAFLPITAELWPAITAGEVPGADDEVLAGADVLADLDAEIGDEITLGSASLTSAVPGAGSSGAQERSTEPSIRRARGKQHSRNPRARSRRRAGVRG